MKGLNQSIAILITGKEVLDGRTPETNSHLIIRELSGIGFEAKNVLSCGDSIQEIVKALQFLAKRARVIIVSGGLGPTTDDLTREAVAKFAGIKLILDSGVLIRLEDFFRQRKRPFDPSNCKQALFPKGAKTIDNPVGSALGFQLSLKKPGECATLICTLPGVPRELAAMVSASVIPIVKKELGGQQRDLHILRIFGLGESMVGTRVKNSSPTKNVQIGYRVNFPEVEVNFSAKKGSNLKQVVKKAKKGIGNEYIFSEDSAVGIEGVVHRLLTLKKLTIATAESCTAGLLSAKLTDTPGSSQYFLGGVISYSNLVKIKELGVSKKTLARYGAVSYETAKEMANGVRRKLGAKIGISITGIAGPDGGTPAKPVGTFFIGYSTGKELKAYRFYINSNRKLIRVYAVWSAADLLRRHLLQLPINEQKL